MKRIDRNTCTLDELSAAMREACTGGEGLEIYANGVLRSRIPADPGPMPCGCGEREAERAHAVAWLRGWGSVGRVASADEYADELEAVKDWTVANPWAKP